MTKMIFVNLPVADFGIAVILGYSNGWLPDFTPEAHDVPLDAILSDTGVMWQK